MESESKLISQSGKGDYFETWKKNPLESIQEENKEKINNEIIYDKKNKKNL